MDESMVKVKYKGTSPIRFWANSGQSFKGIVKPGDIIDVSQEVYDIDLKNHDKWELATGSSPKKIKKEKSEDSEDK